MARNRFYVEDDRGWVVRDRRDGLNVYGPGWRWNSRSVARSVLYEYEHMDWTPLEEERLARAKQPQRAALKSTAAQEGSE